MVRDPDFQKIKKVAWDLGFDLCSVSPLEIPARDQSAYLDWCATGSAGTMAYMTREPAKRTQPKVTFPHAKSVLTLGVSYYRGDFPKKPGPAYGRIARYAWGEDYHNVIGERLQKLMAELENQFGVHGETAAIDTKPLLERSLAEQSGLGFVGKNTMLIAPRSSVIDFHVGSWIFLAEILVETPLPIAFGDRPPPSGRGNTGSLSLQREGWGEGKGCGACTKCLDACPTDAFEGPYRLRANKCISYLTIENKGEIPVELREKVGDWLFGCDVCQEVCPFNAREFESRWPEFEPTRGAGAWISLKEIFGLTDDGAFKLRFGKTPLARAKRRGLLRNAAVVAGNSADASLIPLLEKLTDAEDTLLAEHAQWAIRRLAL